MAMRQRCDRDPLVQFRQDRRGPVSVDRPGHRDHLAAGASRQIIPGVDMGRELIGQDQDPLTFAARQVRRRDSHAIARRRDQRDVVRARADQGREQAARPLTVVEEVLRADVPWLAFSADRLGADRRRMLEQRRHVGAVQVGDIIRQIEQMALAGNHRRSITWDRREPSCRTQDAEATHGWAPDHSRRGESVWARRILAMIERVSTRPFAL